MFLTVRYILKDIETGEVLMEVPKETWTEEYSVGASSSASSDNEREALAVIIDDLSERIYLKTLTKLSRQ